LSEVKQGIDTATRFSEDLSKETDENKILSMINGDDVSKASIINLDEWWSRFETFDGLTKTACLMMFSNYLIISCLFTITINLYGDYLIDRFKLEEKYPKVAIFIKYRRKFSKYLILSNIIYILLVCLINIFYGITVISIIYT